jgi:hypothetical protein
MDRLVTRRDALNRVETYNYDLNDEEMVPGIFSHLNAIIKVQGVNLSIGPSVGIPLGVQVPGFPGLTRPVNQVRAPGT